jgi:opacity protein-like surface antigen
VNKATRFFLVLPLIVAAVHAAEAEGRFYLGVTAGYSSVDGLADTNANAPTLNLPDSLTLNGVPFDDSDIAWGGFAGYQFHKYVAVELGYANLGRFRSETLGFSEVATLESKEFSVRAKFRYPLGEKLSATWHVGLSTSSFDAEGNAAIAPGFTAVPIDPRGGTILLPFEPPPLLPPAEFVGFAALPSIPFTDPEDEIGYLWGFGVNWKFSKRFSLELSYSRHDVQVLDVDTFNLGLIISL